MAICTKCPFGDARYGGADQRQACYADEDRPDECHVFIFVVKQKNGEECPGCPFGGNDKEKFELQCARYCKK